MNFEDKEFQNILSTADVEIIIVSDLCLQCKIYRFIWINSLIITIFWNSNKMNDWWEKVSLDDDQRLKDNNNNYKV